MKRLPFFLTLLITICSLIGCGNAGRAIPASPSAFAASFSLESIIEANERYLIAKHTLSSGTVSEPPTPFFQKHEEAIVQIDPTNVSAFIEAIRFDILETLTKSGTKIDGLGTGGQAEAEYFSYRYSEGEIDGVINVWGVRGEGTSFTLIVLIIES
jgi:hypothetical protein